MTRIWERAQAFYNGMEPQRRRALWGAVALATVVVGLVVYWTQLTSWQTVLSGRSYDDLLVAAAALDEAKVQYRISDQGTLQVPTASVGAAKGAMTKTEVMPGLSDVSELQLGLTPKAQEWAFLRAKEGDLARVLTQWPEVVGAVVQIVPRTDTLFFEDVRPARASVFIKLAPGRSLSTSQVDAVASLVSGAVDGLESGLVTVTDDHGRLLRSASDAGAGFDPNDPSDLLGYRESVEQAYESSVTQALLPVVGFGTDFSVTASVDLDVTSLKRQSRVFDTEKQGVVSEEITESKNSKGAPSGVPGVDANLPERAASAGANAQDSETSKSTTNYRYPEIDETVTRPAGDLRRVSVAVQVNQARLAELAAMPGAPSEADLRTAIEAAVRGAIGYTETRGDSVTVQVMPFAPVEWQQADSAPSVLATVEEAVPYLPAAVLALALVLGFLFVVRPIVRTALDKPKPVVADAPAKAVEGEETEPAQKDEREDLAARLNEMVNSFKPVDTRDLNRLVERESATAAEVVRLWSRA